MGYHGLTLATTRARAFPAIRIWSIQESKASFMSAPPYAFRDAQGLSESEYVETLATELEETINRLGADTIAAMIAEPIMGTGGVIVPPEGYFARVHEICDRNDILLYRG